MALQKPRALVTGCRRSHIDEIVTHLVGRLRAADDGLVRRVLVRAAQVEHPERFLLADADVAALSTVDFDGLASAGEWQVAIRGDQVLAPRLARPADLEPPDVPWVLDTTGPNPGTIGAGDFRTGLGGFQTSTTTIQADWTAFKDRNPVGSYRRTVSKTLPKATRIAWAARKDDIQKLQPGVTRAKFVYVMKHTTTLSNI